MEVHLFNPLWDATGGSEWRTLSLFELLAPHADVSVWTEYTPDPALLGRWPIREMLKVRSFPTRGTFVFVGVYWEIGAWLKQAKPERVILVYNVIDPPMLEDRLEQLKSYGIDKVELRFSSALMAEHAYGRSGTVEFSPIDLEAFSPSERNHEQIVIGRHSRDQAFKHHPDDPALYRRLASNGATIRILGGTCLAQLAGQEGIELLPANSVPAPDFLRSLNIFFYRIDPSITETYGRVIAEAMAAGLPVVAERRGGYQSLIQSGQNGYLFSSEDEAIEILNRLIKEPETSRKIGDAARHSIVDLYERENKKLLQYYLG